MADRLNSSSFRCSNDIARVEFALVLLTLFSRLKRPSRFERAVRVRYCAVISVDVQGEDPR